MVLTIIFFTLLFTFIFTIITYIAILVFDFNVLSNINTIIEYLMKALVIIIILLFLTGMIGIIDSLINSNDVYNYGMRYIYGYVF